jgi:hypothetical protein
MTAAAELMADWTGPIDERYIAEQARRMTAMTVVTDTQGVKGNGTDTGLADALDHLTAHLLRFVWFPKPAQAVAVALWIAHAHALEAVEQSPILAIVSPVKQSGKSRLLDVIETVVPTPWRIERPSEAVLYRRIARDRPTVLMDEADTIFEDRKGQYEGIRAVFNAGNRRGTVVSRVMPKGKSFDLQDFAIFSPKAVAGLGRFPETIVDRSIVIAMMRRSSQEKVERLRARAAAELGEPIRTELARHCGRLRDLSLSDDRLPDELDDRAQDNWESLFALADHANASWASRARSAALELQADRSSADDNAAIALLTDLRSIFGEDGYLTTTLILDSLHGIDSSPWSEWSHGKPLSARGLARLLEPFGIRPDRTSATRGYSRRSFVDVWTRFLPLSPVDPSQPSQPPIEFQAEARRIFGDDLHDSGARLPF